MNIHTPHCNPELQPSYCRPVPYLVLLSTQSWNKLSLNHLKTYNFTNTYNIWWLPFVCHLKGLWISVYYLIAQQVVFSQFYNQISQMYTSVVVSV